MNFKKLSTEGLARGSARHPWVTISIWILALVLSIFLTVTYLGDALSMNDRATNNPESQRASELLQDNFKDLDKLSETIVIDSELNVDDPAYSEFVGGISEDIDGLGDKVISSSVSYYQTGSPAMISKDKHTTIIPLELAGSMDDAMGNIDEIKDVVHNADKRDTRFTVGIVGGASLQQDFMEVSENDLQVAEKYGILIAIVILTLVFGTLISALIPIIIAIVAIIAAVGASSIIGLHYDLSFFIVNMITMMGLAVGIDYSLFIVSRYREELAKGEGVVDAIAIAGSTASRAVFFSGLMVLLALVGMLIVPHTIFKSLGTGAILVVIFAVLASLTLLPASLRLMGSKVNSLRIPFVSKEIVKSDDNSTGGFWHKAANVVMRRPVVSLILTLTVLVALAIPYAGIELGSSMGPESLPDSVESKEAYLLLNEKFSVGDLSPAIITIDGTIEKESVQKGIDKLTRSIENDDVFGPIDLRVNEKGDVAFINVPINSPAQSDKAESAVKTLRERYIPKAFDNVNAEVLVTGEKASQMDFTKITEDYIPIVFVFVLGLSFLLLTVIFRSLVVPIKAILMNLLSVGAAYGLMVLVFQNGVGAEFLGFQQVDVIEAWIPLFLFSILFGLSMDYHVFLLSRIKENFDETGDNTKSVAFGLGSTGSIITGAAIIMVAVFGGFAAGDLVMFQQMGFGLAVAVLLDATIVRSLLDPASMRLLGARNWYLPKALQWLPNLNIEGYKKDKADPSDESQPATDIPSKVAS